MGLEDLKQISSKLSQSYNPLVIADFAGNEDCGALLYAPNDEYVMLSSVDFITPVVDEPYLYGQIAASNALSDIFAMGGIAKSALNVLMWDNEHFHADVAREILRGGLDKITESGAFLLGGHTIRDTEQKYGLSVNGIVHKDRIWRNNTAHIGDKLVLSKPIGSGVLTTAFKGGLLKDIKEVADSMAMLNLYAMQIAQKYEIHACTDITGFGLIGHGIEMCGDDKALLFYTSELPIFASTLEFASMGIVPNGSYENKSALQKYVKISTDIKDDIVYYDVQTSGGLLFALPSNSAKSLVDELQKNGMQYAKIVGEVMPKNGDISITLG